MTAYAQLDALGDATRRNIFEMVAARPYSVGDLADELPISRPAVSQHLRVLKDAGLVADRANGARRIYSVEPDALIELRNYFDQFWNQALNAFKEAAESANQKEKQGGKSN